MRFTLTLAALLALAGVGLAQEQAAWQVGDGVLANFRGEGRWFPAVVVERLQETSGYRVVYQDGYTEERQEPDLHPDTMGPGTPVDVPRDGTYQRATVKRRLDDVAWIVFDEDGAQGWQAVGRVGVRTQDLPAARPDPSRLEQPELVLAPWGDDAAWLYAGQVVARDADLRLVVFQDGSRSWRKAAQLEHRLPRQGDAVQVRPPGQQAWAPATVETLLRPYAVRVRLADGSQLWCALSCLRLPAGD